jgi:hypothetical protein
MLQRALLTYDDTQEGRQVIINAVTDQKVDHQSHKQSQDRVVFGDLTNGQRHQTI